MPRKKSNSLSKLIIPLIIIIAIFYFMRGNKDKAPPTTAKKTEANQLATSNLSTVVKLKPNKMGVSFEYPSAWGEIDAQNDTALVLMFDDTCVGGDCDSLYVQKTAGTSADFAQTSELVKKMSEVQHDNTLTFYEDKSNQVVSGKKLFAATMQGNIYSFELSGKNSVNYDFKNILRSFAEVAPSAAIPTQTSAIADVPSTTSTTDTTNDAATAPTPGTTYRFQSCGDLTLYPQEEFYPEFVTQVTKMRAFSDPLKLKMYGNVKLTVNDIKQACYSSEGGSFLALVPASTLQNGSDYHIFKFDIISKTLTEARRMNNFSDLLGPGQFGKRDGRLINMSGAAKIDACVENADFAYDYVDNTMTAKQICSTCDGSTEKKCEQP